MPTMNLREPDEAQNGAASFVTPRAFTPTVAAVATTPPTAFTFEPELGLRTPRRVVYQSGTRLARRILANALAGVVLGGLWLTSRDLRELSALKDTGVVAEGRIYDKYIRHDEDKSYYLRYRYPTNAGMLAARAKVRKKEYNATQIGDPYTVTFSPAAPAFHRAGRVDDARIETQRNRWIGGVGVVALLFGFGFAVSEAGYRRSFRLLQNGVAVKGEIIGRRTVKSDGTLYYLAYQFTPASGPPLTREVMVSPAGYQRFDNNEMLTILYDPQNPNCNTPYTLMTEVKIA